MPLPLVSVVIAAHNGEKYLAEAIQSVLNQDYPHFELWVIDNGSTDCTEKVARSFPSVHYRYSKLANVALARNQGASLASGDYIAFLDQDDMWASHKLGRQVEFLEKHNRFSAVIGLQKMFLEEGCQKPHWLKQAFLEKPQFAYLPSALMVRRAAFVAANCFDPAFILSSDVDWFFKAMHAGLETGVLEEVLLHRRIHEENNSNKCLELQKELLIIIKNSLKRRREKS